MPDARAPDGVQTVTRHGRGARRALWIAPGGDLSPYLEQAFAWPGVQSRRWIARTRWRAGREETRRHVGSAGAACPWSLTADAALARLQAPWTMEKRVFRVRDVTDDDDRWHGRTIGHGVSRLRTGAITLMPFPLRTGRWPHSPRWRSLSWEDKMRTLKSPNQGQSSVA